MLKYKILILCLIESYFVHSQKPTINNHVNTTEYRLKNSLLFEIGGGNLSFSLNYERTVVNTKIFFLNACIGGSFFLTRGLSYSLSGNVGDKSKNYFEFGVGRTDFYIKLPSLSDSRLYALYYPFIGLRYQNTNIFKFQILYLIPTGEGLKKTIYFGIGFGRAFNFETKENVKLE